MTMRRMSLMVLANHEDEVLDEGESAVTKEDAPCPLLVLDALRDGKPHEYKRIINELDTVAAVSKKARDNLYETVRRLVSYDPPLVKEENQGNVRYLSITDTGKEQLQYMKTLETGDFPKCFIQEFMELFIDRERILKVIREGGSNIYIRSVAVDWFSPDLGNTVLGHPRYMISLAEEALAHLNLSEEPVTVHLIYPCSPVLFFEHIDAGWKEYLAESVKVMTIS